MRLDRNIGKFSYKYEDIEKSIEIFCGDLSDFSNEIDVMLVSAFKSSTFIDGYALNRKSLIGSLKRKKNISVKKLSKSPEVDLRNTLGIWLSCEMDMKRTKIRRIACAELSSFSNIGYRKYIQGDSIRRSVQGFFGLLSLANNLNIETKTIALPLIGTGTQKLPVTVVMDALLDESIKALATNSKIMNIIFVDKDIHKCEEINKLIIEKSNGKNEFFINTTANTLEIKQIKPYVRESVKSSNDKYKVFISYSSKEYNLAAEIRNILELNGFSCWMAPESIPPGSAYPNEINKAIERSEVFIILLSNNSMQSIWIPKELDIAVNLQKTIIPFKLDASDLNESFSLYLSNVQRIEAYKNPTDALQTLILQLSK